MNQDEQKLQEEAEEIRRDTAEEAPELQEHDRVAELERELEDMRSKALYAAAETQNVRRRLEADKQQAAAYAVTGFAREMLAVKDNLDRAFAVVTEAQRADPAVAKFLEGIDATARELDNVFARHGITRIEALGQPLDPHRHQAMMQVPTADAEPGTIVQELQSGYMLKDRLLRPALVGVAKRPD
jgi:molecular chaperone GrpE